MIKRYSESLRKRKVLLRNEMAISRIDHVNQKVTFRHTQRDNVNYNTGYDLLHVMPRFTVPPFLKSEKLLDKDGLVDTDPFTLKHRRYNNVWSFGDCSSLRIGHNLSTLKEMAPILENNLANEYLHKNRMITQINNGKWNQAVYLGGKRMLEVPCQWDEIPERKSVLSNEYAKYVYYNYYLKNVYLSSLKKGL